jgi:putative oxidoreductase
LNNQFRHIINNSRIELAARWILGLTFIYASFHKITAPAEFAKIIYGYDLFPSVAINLIAIIIPFLELVTGLALVIGLYPRSAAIMIDGLLLAYIIALTINFIRGHEFDCGCFTAGQGGHIDSPVVMLVRDSIYFMLSMPVILFSGIRKMCLFGRQRFKIY